MSHSTFSSQLLQWFAQHGRKDLPWQRDINPYRVWVSEIMLQQTQVSTVIPYYIRFLESLPSVEALALADEDHVLHLWTGLGYYARARNLHKCAKIVLQEHRGVFPSELEELIALPGIGRSTAGAILSIACKKRAPILDGNVKRVLTRYFAVAGWPGSGKVQKKLWQYAEQLTPDQEVAAYTQAIMDLGATVCTRSSPNCPACPLKSECSALKNQSVEKYPESKPRNPLPVRHTYMLVLTNAQGEILLEKRPSTGIWGGLWSLPQNTDRTALLQPFHTLAPDEGSPGLPSNPTMRHTFSHFHLDIEPIHARAQQPANMVMEANRLRWYRPENGEQIGLAAPIQRIIKSNRRDSS